MTDTNIPVREEKKAVGRYVPTEEAKSLHRHLILDGVVVGVGGDVKVTRTAPKKSYVAKEATAEQYEKLYHLGYTHLVEKA